MSEIKLYGFYPAGFGANSFFVAAHSEDEAINKVNEYVSKNKPFNWQEWPRQYETEVVEVGVVLVNDNN